MVFMYEEMTAGYAISSPLLVIPFDVIPPSCLSMTVFIIIIRFSPSSSTHILSLFLPSPIFFFPPRYFTRPSTYVGIPTRLCICVNVRKYTRVGTPSSYTERILVGKNSYVTGKFFPHFKASRYARCYLEYSDWSNCAPCCKYYARKKMPNLRPTPLRGICDCVLVQLGRFCRISIRLHHRVYTTVVRLRSNSNFQNFLFGIRFGTLVESVYSPHALTHSYLCTYTFIAKYSYEYTGVQ